MTPCRSLLYVPANRADLLQKIPRFEADAYILDLEDGVPEEQKGTARDLIGSIVPALLAAGRSLHVRVNRVDSPWHRADLQAAVSCGLRSVHVPKVQSEADLVAMDRHLDELETDMATSLHDIELYPTIETARALLAAPDICGASRRVVAVVLGADDLTAELGSTRTPEGGELELARQMVVLAAAAHGLVPIDATFPFHRDLDGCRRDATRARLLGFRGKQAIHPAQCPLLNEAFTPSADEVARDQAIVTAAEAARRRGHGTSTAHGTQIDAAVETAARRRLAAMQSRLAAMQR